MSYTDIVLWIIISLMPPDKVGSAIHQYKYYYKTVAIIESNMNRYAVSRVSSASSYFQMTIGAFETAKKRAARYGWKIDAKYPGELNYDEQRALVFIDLYARKNTNALIKLMLSGNVWAGKKIYYKYHHTNPDKQTRRRVTQIFKKRY